MQYSPKHNHLEAFCSVCPDPQNVTAFLQPMGFSLAFQMDALPTQDGAMPLPAQYHYEDNHGTQVIYLAGRDDVDSTSMFPRHQSRWWVYPGSNHERYTTVIHALALRWFLIWLSSSGTNSAQHNAGKEHSNEGGTCSNPCSPTQLQI